MLRKSILLLVIITCPIISCSRQDNNPLGHKRSPTQNLSKPNKPTQAIIAETKQNKLYNDYQSTNSSQNSKAVVDYVQQYQLESKRVPKDNNDLMSEIKEADKIHAQLKSAKLLDKSNKHLVKKHKEIKAHAEKHRMQNKKDLSATWKSVSPQKSKKIRKANSNIDHLKLPHMQNKAEVNHTQPKPAEVKNNNEQHHSITPESKNNILPTKHIQDHIKQQPNIHNQQPSIKSDVTEPQHETHESIPTAIIKKEVPVKNEIQTSTEIKPVTNKKMISAPKVPPFPSSSMIEHKTDFTKIFNFDNFMQMLDNLKNKLINFFVSLI